MRVCSFVCVSLFFFAKPPHFFCVVVDIDLHIAELFKKQNPTNCYPIYSLRQASCGRGLTTALLRDAYSSVAPCGGACESCAEYSSPHRSPPPYACLCARGRVCDVCVRICVQKKHMHVGSVHGCTVHVFWPRVDPSV